MPNLIDLAFVVSLLLPSVEALADRFLITCTLAKNDVKCLKDTYKDNASHSISKMRLLHKQALSRYSYLQGYRCKEQDKSDRLEYRLVTFCLDASNKTIFEYRTVWPIDARAINYYRKRNLNDVEAKMKGQARLRDRNGGELPSGKDVRYGK